jgi:pyruvate dehydrogenase E1 component alpha subunit
MTMEPLTYIGDVKHPGRPRPEELNDEQLLRLFGWMVLLRTFDERAVSLQRQGRIGTYPMFWGEEATQAGALLACSDDDWIFPSYRQGVIAILRGLAPSVPLKYRRGYGGSEGFWNPRDFRVGPSVVPIATQIPHAVGLAWAAKIKADPICSLVFFGDGATSEGDFHEGMNIAAVLRAPTVFFCVNNQWAISTPFHRQTAVGTIAEKAAAYGMPATRVDGFDPIACWHATRDALARARAGEGPSLIEAFCYRLKPHGTADDPGRYRDEEVTERWMEMEPLGRTSRWLKGLGVLTDNSERTIEMEARSIVNDAVEELEAGDVPGRDVLFETVYASGRPWTFDES